MALPDGLGRAALEVAALHEVAHVRRSDYAWHAAQRAVSAAFAAHPLVWALGRGLDLDRERAADAAVLEAGGDRRSYADLLFSYATLPAPALALGAARGSSSLKHRIDAMTRPLSPARSRRFSVLGRLAGLAAVVLVVAGAALVSPSSAVALEADGFEFASAESDHRVAPNRGHHAERAAESAAHPTAQARRRPRGRQGTVADDHRRGPVSGRARLTANVVRYHRPLRSSGQVLRADR